MPETLQERAPRPRGRPVSMKKRRAMLDAAIAEFQRHGYDGANMDAIAAGANVSKRTLYNHFASKEALFRSLMDEMVRRVRRYSQIEYRPDAPLREQLLGYARDVVDAVRDPETRDLIRALLSEQMRSPDLIDSAIAKYWRDEYGLANWFAAARADGRLRTDSPERMSQRFAAMIKGIGVWPILFRRDPPSHAGIDDAVEEAVDMFIEYHGT